VHIPQPVTEVHNGLRGRPRKVIDVNFVKEAMSDSRQIARSELARLLGVHRNTLRLFMQRHGIKREFSDISDPNLDSLLMEFKRRRPESGIRYIVGFLRTNGIRVQHLRVVRSLRRIDRLGQVLRDRRVKAKAKYHVTRPNALWHIDGHHKLIRWGIVIHAFIDGFCRTVRHRASPTDWELIPF